MLDEKARTPRTSRRLLPGETLSKSPRQKRVMLIALLLLHVSLALVLYRDRDFWFPDGNSTKKEAADARGDLSEFPSQS